MVNKSPPKHPQKTKQFGILNYRLNGFGFFAIKKKRYSYVDHDKQFAAASQNGSAALKGWPGSDNFRPDSNQPPQRIQLSYAELSLSRVHRAPNSHRTTTSSAPPGDMHAVPPPPRRRLPPPNGRFPAPKGQVFAPPHCRLPPPNIRFPPPNGLFSSPQQQCPSYSSQLAQGSRY